MIEPKEADRIIKSTFRVKRRDTLPYTGWLRSTRKDLAQIYNTLGYKIGAEVGVQSGKHAKLLFNNVEGLKLFCIDPWTAYNKMTQEKVDRTFNSCVSRLKGCNVEYIKKTSMDAVGDIPDRSLDFVYIDGLHEFDPVMTDLIYWSKKVRFGGIVAGHDYYEFYQGGIVKAVNAYTHAHNIHDWYITTGDADKYPSFFWVQKKEYQQGYSF